MRRYSCILFASVFFVLHGCNTVTESNKVNESNTFISAVPTPTSTKTSNTNSFKESSILLSDNKSFITKPSASTRLPDAPEALVGSGLAAVNHKLYLIGGGFVVHNKYCNSNSVYEYDITSKTWTEKEAMPTTRDSFGTVVIGTDIYTIGGYIKDENDSIIELAVVEKYDTLKNQWSSKADMKYPRGKLCTATVNGMIYAIGGMNNNQCKVEEYDPSLDIWTEKNEAPKALRRAGTAAVNGKIYCIAGEKPDGRATVATVEEYDPDDDLWISKKDIPISRTDMAIAAVDGQIYVMGGWTRSGILDSLQIYDVSSDQWTNGTPMTSKRYYHTATAVDQSIYVIGGSSLLPKVTDIFEVYQCK